MNRISITDVLSNSCLLAAELGSRLFELLQNELEVHETIELDFAEYKYVSKVFIEESLGLLCRVRRWKSDEFERRIHILNMEEDDREEVEVVVADVMMREIQK